MAGKKGMTWGVRGIVSPTNLQQLRNLIDAKMLISELKNHISGQRKMDGSQVTAAVALLRKVMPDLSATELSGDPERPILIAEESIVGRLLPELAAEELGKDRIHCVHDGDSFSHGVSDRAEPS